MDFGQQALGSIELAIDESRVQNQFRLGVGGASELRLLPVFDLTLHRLEVSLNAVHTYRESVDQVEALAVLCQNRRKHAWDNFSDSTGSLPIWKEAKNSPGDSRATAEMLTWLWPPIATERTEKRKLLAKGIVINLLLHSINRPRVSSELAHGQGVFIDL